MQEGTVSEKSLLPSTKKKFVRREIKTGGKQVKRGKYSN